MSAGSCRPEATIVVVPRERFSLMERCVKQIYAHTSEPFELIVLDTNSPRCVAQKMKQWEQTHSNCRVIRSEKFLYPYEAKNLACGHITTEWAVFVDSDVMVAPDWLTHLLTAARETAARVVHPLYLVEQAGQLKIHMTDGQIKEVNRNGQKKIHLVMGHVAQDVSETRGLARKESDFVEFHTFMIRRDLLREMGPFEETNLAEDVAYSLRLWEKKEKIVFEPKAVITYVAGPPFERYDLPYFRFRWNLKMARESTDRLKERFPLTEEYVKGKLSWVAYHHSRISPGFGLARRFRRWSGQMQSRLVERARRLTPALKEK